MCGEQEEIPTDGLHIVFDPQRVNVYADGHRVEGEA